VINFLLISKGDVILYESAVAIHGRPLPFNGKYMANVFAHTKPIGWDYANGHAQWAHLKSKFDHFPS
jgi:hypothetical protein